MLQCSSVHRDISSCLAIILVSSSCLAFYGLKLWISLQVF